MSAGEAVRLTYRTKHVHDLGKRYRELFVDFDERTFTCARVCEPWSYECGFHFRLIDTTKGSAHPKEVAWVYVDPFERKLWFSDEAGWSFEDLGTK